ncbi:MAG: hypothetical protein ACI9GZ_003439, partial [Bacteroidia bacterium]
STQKWKLLLLLLNMCLDCQSVIKLPLSKGLFKGGLYSKKIIGGTWAYCNMLLFKKMNFTVP